MAKALMICPFCDDGRAFTWQGVALHVKAKHPDKLKELKDNKAMYLEKFACDETGNPTAPEPKEGSSPEGSFPEEGNPEPEEPEPEPEPEPEEPEPAPEEPEPEPKPEPAPHIAYNPYGFTDD